MNTCMYVCVCVCVCLGHAHRERPGGERAGQGADPGRGLLQSHQATGQGAVGWRIIAGWRSIHGYVCMYVCVCLSVCLSAGVSSGRGGVVPAVGRVLAASSLPHLQRRRCHPDLTRPDPTWSSIIIIIMCVSVCVCRHAGDLHEVLHADHGGDPGGIAHRPVQPGRRLT